MYDNLNSKCTEERKVVDQSKDFFVEWKKDVTQKWLKAREG